MIQIQDIPRRLSVNVCPHPFHGPHTSTADSPPIGCLLVTVRQGLFRGLCHALHLRRTWKKGRTATVYGAVEKYQYL